MIAKLKLRWAAMMAAGIGLAVWAAAWIVAGTVSSDTLILLWKASAWCMGTSAMLVLADRTRPLKPETVFLVLMSFFGLFYIFIITPMSAPDETAHLRAVLTLSSRIVNGGDICDVSYFSAEGLTGHENTLQAFQSLTQGLFTEKLSGTMEEFTPFVFTYPLMYVPQTIGAVIAQLLGLNRFWLYVLGDLCSWLFYTAVILTAIRTLPRGKLLMALAAAVPMALQQCTSLSTDTFVISMSFLLIALLLRAAERTEPMKAGEAIAILAVGALLSPAKAVYFLLLFLAVLIPSRRFSRPWQKWGFIALMLALAVVLTFSFQISLLMDTVSKQEEGVTNYYSIGWVLTHIPQTAVMFVKTLFPSGIWFLVDTAMGIQLSGLTLDMVSGYLYTMLFVLLAAALCGREGDPALPLSRRLTWLGLAVLVTLAVMATMMISWTEVGEPVIQGVQGRYLLPIAPLVLLSLQNRTFRVTKDMTRAYALVYALMELLCVNHILGHFA